MLRMKPWSNRSCKLQRPPPLSPQPHWTMWGGADSPELIDMPPRRCFLITYWSGRPDMQSICQGVSLTRWDECPQNTFHQAVLIKGGISVHDHIEAACQVLHIEPCQNLFSLAEKHWKLQQIHSEPPKIVVFCFGTVLPNLNRIMG